MIAIGVVAAVWLANKRWVSAGGDPDDMSHDRARRGASGRRRRPAVPRDDRLAPVHRRSAEGVLRSGRAGSASGARSHSVRAARSGSRADEACRSVRSPMRALPRFPWRRHSAGSATGSTKSCSASRPPCAVGAEDRSRTSAAGIRAVRDVPSDVPLRSALVPDPVRRADLHRQAMGIASAARQPVLALRRRVHVRALLHRAHPNRLRVAVVRICGSTSGSARSCSSLAVAILVIMNFHEPSHLEDDGSATLDAEEAAAQ